jgi:NADH-quinone oxidoreductase subunit M
VADSAAMAINGATLQMFNHGIITGASSSLSASFTNGRTRANCQASAALSTKTPTTTALHWWPLFASLGLPGLAGFWAEFFTFRGAFALVPIWAQLVSSALS